MDAPHLFDGSPGGSTARDFASACVRARAAVGTMRSLAAVGGAPGAVERLGDAAQLAREVDLILARAARDIEVQSDVAGGGIAKRHGFRSAADLVAATMGTTRAEAYRLLEAGRALEEMERAEALPDPESDPEPAGAEDRPGDGDGGDDDPPSAPKAGPRYPVAAAALDGGEISADCFSQIVTMLDGLSEDVPNEHKCAAAAELTARAMGIDATRFAKIVARFKASLDIEAHTRNLARMRRARTLRIWENRAGMLEIHGELDPETAAPVRAALDTLVGDAMRSSRDTPGVDSRTSDQMRADALADLARHALGCTSRDPLLPSTTLVVRANATDLDAGVGLGEIDGCTPPVDITTVRRLTTSAILVPAILGATGELLNLGRRIYPFSRAQRLALGERDGGCAFCGAPPAWCEAHHIRFWGRGGRTDLANGVLLCSNCHHVIHDQGWDINATATEVWFIPPANADPARTPRQGGRARFHAPSRPGENGDEGPPGQRPHAA